jgi:hypothetical protein
MTFGKVTLAMAWVVFVQAAVASNTPDQPAIDACIDSLTASGKASAPGGTVLQSSFSEAGTEVLLQDGGGSVWRCIAYSDGEIGLLEEASPQEIEAARAAPDPSDYQEQVRFDAGTSGATLTRTLGPGEAFQFVLGAQADQALSVGLTSTSGDMYYTIRNPDGSILLEGTDAATAYRGQLLQSGDHTVEVINQTSRNLTYDISFGIE